MAKLIKLTKELLEKHALSTLRALGREVGVKSPASKSKPLLIEEILSVQNTGVVFAKSKKGAPVKSKVDLSDFYDVDESDSLSFDVDSFEEYPYYSNRNYENRFSSMACEDNEQLFETEGRIEIYPSGFGFLRVKEYECYEGDSYISSQIIAKYDLRAGDKILALAKKANNQKAPCVTEVLKINGFEVDFLGERPNFDKLTSCYPNKKFDLSYENDVALSFIDLFAPIGKGQRAIIVAPPKVGKTTIIKKLAKALEKNHNGTKIFILLIDERPEEVTDIKMSVRAEVVHSTFDESSEHHVRVAEMVLNRAKRITETGNDVVIFLDSLTRLTRAYNERVESTGKTLSGGIEAEALKKVKKFFGSARNLVEGGSLTIIATAMVGLGGKFEDFVYEELKGTGNMELHLNRELSDKRIFPAIDVKRSGTRQEQLLLSDKEIELSYKLRGTLGDKIDNTATLIKLFNQYDKNELCDKIDDILGLKKD